MLYADSKETVQRLAFSRKFVRESITRSPASDVRKSLKLLVSVSTTNSLVGLGVNVVENQLAVISDYGRQLFFCFFRIYIPGGRDIQSAERGGGV